MPKMYIRILKYWYNSNKQKTPHYWKFEIKVLECIAKMRESPTYKAKKFIHHKFKIY